ncbi:hypothetical protein [Mesorhizobium sp. KR9-304]|uniref:hypothetical protein n=1 Tax=Mesorhizobium sp. KR9-304 TaxID=3156614 RepID=UPI0032B56712
MSGTNRRETGARALREKRHTDASDEVSQDAAENRLPKGGVGNTEPSGDHDEKTRHSDGRQPPRR